MLKMKINLSTSQSTSVLELAETIFKKIHPNDEPVWKFVEPLLMMSKRIPSTEKAKKLLALRQKQPYQKC